MAYEPTKTPTPRQAEKWTDEEVSILVRLAKRQWRARAIAAHMGRTEAGVRGKAAGCGIDLVSDRSPTPITLGRYVARSDDLVGASHS
nr:hypothetical protein [uncultured Brevundimonas sp.]